MSLLFITGNYGKFKAMKHILPELVQQNIDLEELQDIDPIKVTKHKVAQARRHTKQPFIVEDSYLDLDCLNGLPGPFIKWFEKSIGINGIANICELHNNYLATAGVVIGYSDDQQNVHIFEGTVKGVIGTATGSNGFGFDPIFTPAGHSKSYGEMTFKEKAAISQRTIATNKLIEYLATN